MANKKKLESERHTFPVVVYFTQEENKELMKMAGLVPLSKYIRYKIFPKKLEERKNGK